ncbi:winged helix DNA-binding domain-containing protein [Helcobacillus sp. ACRRO]|uniref:DNA glycosylase AlkZ-like family protein n=1 Tax=Helcobacillus TaxID=1161125 RepID=UPI001EF5A09A|nr:MULTISPECIES: crosslink repair DNA glycosylase YcaQ family protein [Helcobacillus]MCG7427792.1 winged helix DNA-binding domain-containing protein [Helcobacillus sp. ACRRO]MDK7741388.1 crosslink repair DNA glycosylase YcaQ family protein [Helcobacillus massiliensis]WOO92765.1 crosslink repair DNA glycosylase YcaQ family protein [Helcobacillus massiliensis]
MSPAAPTTLPTAHIQGLRVIAHGLTRLREDAAAHMLATQAQLYDSGVRGLQVRSTIPIAEEIAAGRIVRTWSQRGTHHLLAAEDATWMMRLCAPRAC